MRWSLEQRTSTSTDMEGMMRKFYTVVLALLLCITVYETATGRLRCCVGSVCEEVQR